MAVCWAGIVAMVLLALLPSARAAYWNAVQVYQGWQNRLLVSPAFWLWIWATWMALLMPAGMVMRALPFLGVRDAEVWTLAKTLAAFTVIAMGVAVFWHFLAWGSMPISGQLEFRWTPFWPWPKGDFTSYILRPGIP